MLPAFKKTGTQLLPDHKVAMDVQTGDVANRGEGDADDRIPYSLQVDTRICLGLPANS
ncbi:MAG: hypothetical protein LUO82_04595 [Methanomicrobiales archaeon]|nr:hypothetical protein [Methanomicrobiales archaeon]